MGYYQFDKILKSGAFSNFTLKRDSKTLFLKRVKDYGIRLLAKIRFNVAKKTEVRSAKSMTRSEVLLAILAAAKGRPLTPVQVQKAAFLVSKNLVGLITEGPTYDFAPYDYGPFDQAVYSDAHSLTRSGYAEITRREGVNWNQYAASDAGVFRGEEILNSMEEPEREYIMRVSAWVRALSFEELVKAIYVKYPEMKANSIFRG